MEWFAIRGKRCWGQGQITASLCPRHSVTWSLRGSGFSRPSYSSFPFPLTGWWRQRGLGNYSKSQGFSGFSLIGSSHFSCLGTQSHFIRLSVSPELLNISLWTSWCRSAVLTAIVPDCTLRHQYWHKYFFRGTYFEMKTETMIKSNKPQDVLVQNYSDNLYIYCQVVLFHLLILNPPSLLHTLLT